MDPVDLCYKLVHLRTLLVFQVRIQLQNEPISKWSKYLISPADGYGETFYCDPFTMSEVTVMEIDPVEVTLTGKYANNIFKDHRDVVCRHLDELDIKYEITNELNVRIDFLKQ
jgi:hypothetical protein